ncbi:hypothetical protein E2C01_016032 [Portunus trituberculatus]|uniref:Uncharacterized protein n=1 Tax=Portunus trituberculatus TaxID=210409 RepID=A0A5B7DPI8_PORTR|nr:hypothetical protein [Portunus trituberculatus]
MRYRGGHEGMSALGARRAREAWQATWRRVSERACWRGGFIRRRDVDLDEVTPGRLWGESTRLPKCGGDFQSSPPLYMNTLWRTKVSGQQQQHPRLLSPRQYTAEPPSNPAGLSGGRLTSPTSAWLLGSLYLVR